MFSNAELPRTLGRSKDRGQENDPLKLFITQHKVAEHDGNILSFVSENKKENYTYFIFHIYNDEDS